MTKPAPRRKGQADLDRMRCILVWLWRFGGRPVSYQLVAGALLHQPGYKGKRLKALLNRMVREDQIKESPLLVYTPLVRESPPYVPPVKEGDP